MKEFENILRMLERHKSLGSKIAKNQARLIGHVPDVAPLAYLHEIYQGLTREEINKLKDKLGVELPGIYEEFLRISNGLYIFSGNLNLYGFVERFYRDVDFPQPFDLLTPNTVERPKDAKSSFCFIGGYKKDGSRLYIDNKTLNVYRCSRQSARPLNKWWDFWEMLNSEVLRLDRLFDDQGHLMNPEKVLPEL